VWRQAFTAGSYDVDFNQRATLETLARQFQEAAWNHAEALGVGYQRLQEQNRLWVLSRLLMKVEHYPRWGERVMVETWPRAAKSVFAMRDFEMREPGGSRLVAGTSAWLVLDNVSRKPQRVDKLVSQVKVWPDRRALERDPEKLEACAPPSSNIDVTVRYSDIDVNGHVNNARYIRWIVDAYPVDFHREYAAQIIELNFLAEAIAGDVLSVLSEPIGPRERCHSIVKQPDGIDVCRAKVLWQQSASG
jgi:acyl-ACP thioesterase